MCSAKRSNGSTRPAVTRISRPISTAEGGAVVLTIQTKLSWFIGRISVTGVKEPPNQGQLVSATKLQLGYPFALDEVRAASENIRAKLERNGFYDVRINPVLDYDEDTQQVHADFQVTAGTAPSTPRPKLAGAPPAEVAALTRTSRWKTILGAARLEKRHRNAEPHAEPNACGATTRNASAC